MACNRQGDAAADTVFDLMLFRCVSRSRECRLRKASYEPGAWFQRGGLWIGCRTVFHRLFPIEVPSNIFLERVGARLWIPRIMISCGSAAFAFIPSIAGATGISNEGVF